MRFDNAAKIVAQSALMTAIVQRYGENWQTIGWIRTMLAGYVGALEGTVSPDEVLDEMEDTARRISMVANGAGKLW